VKWAAAERWRVGHVAQRLRRSDELECAYAYGISGAEALWEAWEQSGIVHCITADDGEPLAVAGLNKTVVWLLGTDALTATAQRRRALALGGRRWTTGLLALQRHRGMTARLENWVFSGNVESVRWLKSMGFIIATPQPMGRSCQLFSHVLRTG